MSEMEGPREMKEDPLLGLEDGWKNWLRPREQVQASSRDEASQDSEDVKNEPKEEKDTIVIDDNNKLKKTDDNVTGFIKKEIDRKHEHSITIDHDLNNCMKYETIIVRNYSSNSAQESPMADINTIFHESILKYEKQKYHQQILNEIVEDIEETKLETLQLEYIEFLRKAADLETFNCSKCDYQTIHRTNLKTHLLLIHKKEMEITMFQCITDSCRFKTKSLNCLKKHQLTHSEQYSDFENDSDGDWEMEENRPNKTKRRKKWIKSSTLKKRQPLLCDFCTFEAANRQSLKKHNESHRCPDNPGRFLCYVCDYGVNHRTSLQKHLFKIHQIVTKGAHKFTERKCEFCDYMTDSKECFNIHMMQHKNPDEIQWLKCTYCEFKTKHRAALRYHLKNHKVPEEQLRKFMCEVCSKKFKTKGALDIHSLRHKSISEVNKVYKCSECKFQTKFKTSLSAHMEVHRDPTYVCDICGVRSRRKYNHDMHLLTHKTDTEVEVFKCTVCTYSTKFKASFKKHLAKGTHLGAVKRTPSRKPKIKNPDGTVEFDHTCDVCGAKLSSTGALTTHMRIHKTPEELEMFQCPECPFQTKFKGNLVAHQKKHKAPEFKCEICGLQLRTKWNHTMHLLTHKSSTECELFSCCVCSYQTKFKPYLREHLKKRHNILTTQRPGPKPGRRKQNKDS